MKVLKTIGIIIVLIFAVITITCKMIGVNLLIRIKCFLLKRNE